MNNLNRIDPNDELSCCGCLACEDVCPQGAISMTENEKGFFMPSIDEDKCINCGLCLKVCDFKKPHQTKSNIERAFSLVVNDKTVLKNSTSGGAFTALSDVILDHSGCVVGSVMEKDFAIRHIIAKDKTSRDRMRGSKYVQSSTEKIWKQVKTLLSQGKEVLFTGTPCQCAALRSFLGRDYDNLIVVDLLCHGVPNDKLFKDHISYLNNYYNNDIEAYSFRDKHYGWDSYTNVVTLQNGKRKAKWINQIYYSFFVKSVSLRPSCFNCVYRSLHRPSDITIADFWGYDKISGRKNNKGVSLVLIHNEKGQDLVDKCGMYSEMHDVELNRIASNIRTKPTSSKLNVESFWQTYQKGGYVALIDKYFVNSFSQKLRFKIRCIVKRIE